MVKAFSDKDRTFHAEVMFEEDEAQDEADIFLAPTITFPALPSIEGQPLRFARGEAVAPCAVPAPSKRRVRRKPYLGLFDLAVLVLIAACTAVCVYRLFWAMQP